MLMRLYWSKIEPSISDPDHSLDAAIALSTPRDHSGRRPAIAAMRPMRVEARALLIDALPIAGGTNWSTVK
jgi:hypothetical protein